MTQRRALAGVVAALVAATAAHVGLAGSSTTVLRATLTGRYLHTTSAGAGTVTVTITPSQVCWKFTYHGLDAPGDSGIHIAPPPAAGVHKTSVFPFTATTSQKHECDAPTKWGANGPQWLARIAKDPGRFYVIVGTGKYPQGAIGGVLTRG